MAIMDRMGPTAPTVRRNRFKDRVLTPLIETKNTKFIHIVSFVISPTEWPLAA